MPLGRMALALAAILAYQNRDKLGKLLRGLQPETAGGPTTQPRPGNFFDDIGNVLRGSGLNELLDRFRNAGKAETVDSWVADGPNEPLAPQDVAAAIEPETLEELARQTGLSKDELVRRIASELPEAVNRLTPDGEVPMEEAPTEEAREPGLLDDVPLQGGSATGPKIGH